MTTGQELPLAGIRVLDLGSWLAGPAVATIMGDFGAEVVKVEPPGMGDTFRFLKMAPNTPQGDDDYGWIVTNRNKRGLAIDIKQAAGYEALLQIVRQVDVVVTNYRAVQLQKLRLRYEDLCPHNSRLIYAHLTGFGKAGAEVDIPAYDRTTWWARSGLMDAMRPAGGEPRTSALGLGDQSAGLALFGAVMLALYQRERTGKGAEVSSSLTGTGAWCNALSLQAVLGGAAPVRLDGDANLTHAFALPYQTADDRWFSVWASDEEQCFTQMTSLIGLAVLQQDPRFIDAGHRSTNAPLLAQEVAAAVAEKTWAEWKALFDQAGVHYVVASSVEEVVDDPQLVGNGVFPHLQGAAYRATRTVDSPLTMSGVDKVAPGPAPGLGEHSRQILQDYGFSADAIDALCADGTVGAPQ